MNLYTKILVVMTFLLLGAGGWVTSTGSGLAVPDWPTTYDHNMFTYPISEWKGGILYEHGHRLIASTVGFLTILLALWLTLKEDRRWMVALGWIALFTVIVQGILGGVTVLYYLPTGVSVSHAALANVFFCLTIAIAFFSSRKNANSGAEANSERIFDAKRIAFLFPLGVTLLIFGQIILGAIMRHTYELEQGFAIPDFPLSNGRLVPEFTSALVAVHFMHRVTALLVLCAAVGQLIWVIRNLGSVGHLAAPSFVLLMLVLLQSGLGAITIWTERAAEITSLHQLNGALILGVSFYALLAGAAGPASPAEKHRDTVFDEGKPNGYAVSI